MQPTSDHLQAPPADLDAEARARFERVRRLAYVLDSQFPVPLTDLRIGVDGIIGFVPWIGGAAGLALSAVIITQGIAIGARGATVARMVLNAVVDAALNAIPVVGWLSDLVFKANQRNVRLLATHALDPDRTRAQSTRLLVLTAVALVVLVVVVVTAAVVLLVALVRWLL